VGDGGVVSAMRWMAGITLLTACYDAVDPAPTGLVKLMPADTVSVADGVSLIGITATVDRRLPKSLWNVTFTTTLGVFSVNGTSTATVAADTTGTAVVYLRAPRDSGTATITATTDTVVLSRAVHYAPAAPERILLVPSAYSAAAATGTVQIAAQLLRDTGFVSAGVVLKFTASVGTVGTLSAPSDSTGTVMTVYTAPADSSFRGTATIAATVVGLPGVTDTTNIAIVP